MKSPVSQEFIVFPYGAKPSEIKMLPLFEPSVLSKSRLGSDDLFSGFSAFERVF